MPSAKELSRFAGEVVTKSARRSGYRIAGSAGSHRFCSPRWSAPPGWPTLHL